MPDIDNHMDELFQKAAENYPLKTGAGNFDDLMPFIAGEANTATKPVVLKGKRKTALLLLAFLVTGALTGTYILNNSRHNKTANDKFLLQQNKANTPALSLTSAQVNINNDETVVVKEETENTVEPPETIFQKNKPGYNTIGKMFTNVTQPDAVTDEIAATENENTVTKEVTANKTVAETENQQEDKTVKPDPVSKKEMIDKSYKKNEAGKDEAKPSPKKNKNKPVFYYGIAAGVDLNKVKTQDMTKPGFNGGLVLGLQINKKIAVETGVQLSQKKYYSDGKYFNPKAGAMPANMTVNSLQSTSTLIEIPVSVKYNFSKKKNTLYGKAGVSSYIMTKESNQYQAVVSGQQQEVNSTYKTNQGYLASDVRISAGYQHSVNKKINMRIEPYIQIPLKGIGVGSLPVTTTGLQIVLTRN
jgi:hypothetical protein